MHDGRLVIGTEIGELILLETDGSYMAYISDSPVGDEFKIECIVSFSRGFIIAGEGLIYVYERTEDPRNPYKLIADNPFEVKMDMNNYNFGSNMSYQVTSMTLS